MLFQYHAVKTLKKMLIFKFHDSWNCCEMKKFITSQTFKY